MAYYVSKKESENTKRVKLAIILAVLLVAAVIVGLLIGLPRLPVAGKANGLVFSEICTKNESIIADNDGCYRDYVELYNGGEEINLKGYSITDGRANSKPFGEMVLPKDSYCLIFLDKELTGFSLGAAGGDTVSLVNAKGQMVTQVKTVALTDDQVMVYAEPEYAVTTKATPGFPNDEAGYKAFKEGKENENPVLLITEILAENVNALPNESGKFGDAVELYNSGEKAVYLGEYCLSDSVEARFRYRLPSVMLDPGKYIVIYCDGENYVSESGGIHANFGLSKGDTVCLTGRDGSYISVPVQFFGTDISMVRGEDGTFKADPVSLGYANNESGITAFAESVIDKEAELVINEVLLSSLEVPYGGSFVDVVEIINRSDNTVSTAGWYLSDGSDPYAYGLPEKKLAPGEIMLVSCDRAETGFALSQREVASLLSPRCKWASRVSCAGGVTGKSIQRIDASGEELYTAGLVSLGYENTASGAASYAKDHLPKGLIISEIMAANLSYIQGPYGRTCDWVELYNNSDATINLKEYGISTDSSDLGKYTLPDKTLGPGKYTVILLSEKENAVKSGYSHLLFNLSAAGETLYISKDGVIVDYVISPELSGDMAYGRAADGSGFAVMASPTPGSANTNGTSEISAAPTSQTAQGTYDSSVKVTLAGAGTVYYTTDCTTPTQASTRYTGPITLTETTVIRAVSYENGKLPSKSLDLTFVVNEGISLPVVSVVTSPENLWDHYSGIYVKGPNASSTFPYVGANFWQNWEKEATVSLFEKDGTGFSVPCGLSIFGAYSRARDQKGFCCSFRDSYGLGTLNYPLFGEENLSSFESFILRCSGQDDTKSRMRDVLMTSLVAEKTNVAVQKYRPVVLLLNGEFWGVYYIREKAQENYVAGNYNVTRAEVVMTGADGIDKEEYVHLVNYAKTHDLSVKEHYDYVCSLMDIDNYMDYIIAEIYVGNTDNGNIRFFMTPTTKWTWILYDTDYGFADASYDSVKDHLNPEGTGAGNAFSTKLINALLTSPTFKEAFLRRIAWQIDNIWTVENVHNRIAELEGLIAEDMKRDCETWERDYSKWQSHVQVLRDFVVYRNKQLPKFVKNYFGLTDSQMQEYGFHM